jgi:hypothetical protein
MNLFERAKTGQNAKYLCTCCNAPYIPDNRNLKRGWGLFCSKSCSALFKSRLKSLKDSDRIVEMRDYRLKQLGIFKN